MYIHLYVFVWNLINKLQGSEKNKTDLQSVSKYHEMLFNKIWMIAGGEQREQRLN